MNILYHHKRYYEVQEYFPQIGDLDRFTPYPRGGETTALEELRPWFVKSLAVGDFFEKKIGSAKCSVDDNYCKKTGRELAKSRMKLKKLRVIRLETQGGDFYCFLKDNDSKIYELVKYENAKSVFFVAVHDESVFEELL